jgi:hypothetical protein
MEEELLVDTKKFASGAMQLERTVLKTTNQQNGL